MVEAEGVAEETSPGCRKWFCSRDLAVNGWAPSANSQWLCSLPAQWSILRAPPLCCDALLQLDQSRASANAGAVSLLLPPSSPLLTHSLTGVPASLYPPPFSTATQLSCVFESAAMKIESYKCQRLYGGLPRNILTAHLVCPPCVSCPVPVHSLSLWCMLSWKLRWLLALMGSMEREWN